MKKKKIELGRKLFLKKDTVTGLSAEQSLKIVGGWVTHVRETEIDPNADPRVCMSCAPTVQNGCPTHVYSQCQTYAVNGICCSIAPNTVPPICP